MKSFTVNAEKGVILCDQEEIPLYSERGFKLLSESWLKVGWQLHYHYTFTWLGVPCLQLPEDLIRLQEVIVSFKPDWIIECGMAMGGTSLFLASLCALQKHGNVVGVEKDFRPHNRKRVFDHPVSSYLQVIDGDSTSNETFEQVKEKIHENDTVLVLLDSNHGYDHVLKELKLYCQLVTEGSYLIVADTLKGELHDVPRGKEHWLEDNPKRAIEDFLNEHSEFAQEEPKKLYDKGKMAYTLSHFEGGWLKRKGLPKTV
jgi:cephalosporin hydroxylase